MRSNLLVRGRRQSNVTCELYLVPHVLQQTTINERGGLASTRKRMPS
jgi:hypothetical protein